ncbi:MAG: CAP domain-containing protein, partial [Myxococcales bacterium]
MAKRVSSVLACAAVVACAAAMQASRRSPGKIENGEFKPEHPPTANYGPDKALTCPEAGTNGALTEEINQKGAKVKPEADGRLCAMADTLLGWKEKELPPEALRAFLSRYFGIPGTVQRMLISDLETEDVRNVAQAVIDAVMSFAASAQKPLYGMMTERVKKNLTHVVVVFYDQTIDIQPLPKRMAPNTTATLQGTLTGELTKPRVEVVDPIGTLQKSPETSGKAFKAELKCGDHAGKMLVQLVAEKEGADTLVTNFPVWCNAAPPLAAKLPEAAKGPVDPAQAEKQLLDLVNSDRKEAGIKPLTPLPALSDIARNIAQKRAEGKGVTSGDLNSALKQAEIAAPM